VNGTRGLVIGMIASFIVGCSVGMVSGIVLSRFALHGERPFFMGHEPWRSRPPGPGPMLRHLEERLDLSAAQRERIEHILDSSRLGYAAVRESTHAAILRELTPEQRESFRKMDPRLMRERRGMSPPPRGMDRP
jgi:hypothetical protein